jgi:hypothetical protein
MPYDGLSTRSVVPLALHETSDDQLNRMLTTRYTLIDELTSSMGQTAAIVCKLHASVQAIREELSRRVVCA